MNPSASDLPGWQRSRPDPGIPLTGAYFWVPRPGTDGSTWDLATCHDLGVWDGISHRDFWSHVLVILAAHWGKDAVALKRALRGHHTGLPRGRVVHPKSGYVIIHGNDAPLPDWLELVKSLFRLTGVEVTTEFTEHEMMHGDDHRALQAALGSQLLKPTRHH